MTVAERRAPREARRADSEPSSGHFEARTIDEMPALLEQSYQLRYQVYCLERKFLKSEDYPLRFETDEFDAHSIHVGALNATGGLAGTARAVKVGGTGLPLFTHCTLFPHARAALEGATLVEIGRLCVSRSYNRRAVERRTGCGDVFLTLLKALYQATKRVGATHWIAATEPSLVRILAQHGFPCRLIGPESDYFGLVAPYQMDLEELDDLIESSRFPVLEDFVVGLEPEFRPKPDRRESALLIHPVVELPAIDVAPPAPAAAAEMPSESAEHRLLLEFRRAASLVPGYRTLLAEQGVHSDDIRDAASFSRSCPLLSKSNTFDRFPLDQLSVGGQLCDVADVLTSSGHGGRFSFGVTSRSQMAASAEILDQAFDAAFQIESHRTLAINCLPMGVVFASHRMTVANTSVREDMAVALILAFGHFYDQLLLLGDPLFLKRFTDYARAQGVDWTRYRVRVVIGEEIFGEHFRGYLAGCLGLDGDAPQDGFIMSSFGVGELGLHLCYETPATVALRRTSFKNPAFARELLGDAADDGLPLPVIFTFDPRRTFIEVVEPDAQGYGQLTTSMLDPERTVPLLRYQTGDIVRLLDPAAVAALVHRSGVTLPEDVPTALLALRGREREALPNGSHVGLYKDAIYANPEVARQLTGALRLVFSGTSCTMHVQLTPALSSREFASEDLLGAIPSRLRPAHLVVWPYMTFPFGMGLDYERKFTYYVNGAPDPSADGGVGLGAREIPGPA